MNLTYALRLLQPLYLQALLLIYVTINTRHGVLFPTTESRQQTTLVTVTSCESGVCSETASPAIVSTAGYRGMMLLRLHPMEATDYE